LLDDSFVLIVPAGGFINSTDDVWHSDVDYGKKKPILLTAFKQRMTLI
jgi:hypothetical protein